MMVYDAERKIQGFIQPAEQMREYSELSNIIQTSGFQGMKGYFNAYLDEVTVLLVVSFTVTVICLTSAANGAVTHRFPACRLFSCALINMVCGCIAGCQPEDCH